MKFYDPYFDGKAEAIRVSAKESISLSTGGKGGGDKLDLVENHDQAMHVDSVMDAFGIADEYSYGADERILTAAELVTVALTHWGSCATHGAQTNATATNAAMT